MVNGFRITNTLYFLLLIIIILTSNFAVYGDFPNVQQSSLSSFKSYIIPSKEYQLVRNKREANQNEETEGEIFSQRAQSDNLKNEDFPVEYWVRLAQARTLALAVLYGYYQANKPFPHLDEDSELMYPAKCYHQNVKAYRDCLQFTQKCAEEKANSIVRETLQANVTSIKEIVTYYMKHILTECEQSDILKFIDINKEYLANEKPPPSYPHPRPVFHCNQYESQSKIFTWFRMEYKPMSSILSPPNVTLSSDLIPRYFITEMNVDGKWSFPNISVHRFWMFWIPTLPGHRYKVRVTAVSPKYVYPPVTSPFVDIYDTESLTVERPTNLHVVKISLNETMQEPKPSALMRWKSGSGQNASCYADVYIMDIDMHIVERKKGDEAFWVKLDNLNFGRNYSVLVVERFGWRQEAKVSSHLYVPSCLEMRGFSFDLCPPPPPSNIRLENATEGSFSVAWNPPLYMNATNCILHYQLTIDWIYNSARNTTQDSYCSSMIESKNASIQNQRLTNSHRFFKAAIASSETSVLVKNGKSHIGYQLKVVITAVGAVGSSVETSVVCHIGPPPTDSTLINILTPTLTLLGFVPLICGLYLMKSFYEKLQRKNMQLENPNKTDEQL